MVWMLRRLLVVAAFVVLRLMPLLCAMLSPASLLLLIQDYQSRLSILPFNSPSLFTIFERLARSYHGVVAQLATKEIGNRRRMDSFILQDLDLRRTSLFGGEARRYL